MDFAINMLTGFGLSAIISFALYWVIREYIVSKGNESDILSFYEKDVKAYKKLEEFFKERRLVQKPLIFSFSGAVLGAIAYFVGMLIITVFIMYVQEKPSEVPDDGDFSGKAYLIGLFLALIPRTRLYLKAKELIMHFEKIQRNKTN